MPYAPAVRTDRERRGRLPNFAVQALLEIVAAAAYAREDHLNPAIARAEHRFDDVTLAYLDEVEAKLFKIQDVAKMTLEGKSLEVIEHKAEMELESDQ